MKLTEYFPFVFKIYLVLQVLPLPCRPTAPLFQTRNSMASQLFRKICSLFYQKSSRVEESKSFRTIDHVFGDWATATEDLPPPYTDSPKSKTRFHDEKYSPPPTFTVPQIQICPHETSSYEGLQKKASAFASMSTGDTIDALTLGYHEHNGQPDSTSQNARHICVSSPSSLRGCGTYTSASGKDPSHTPGVMLCFRWELGLLDGVRAQIETAAELQRSLHANGIWLCPHKQISDSDVVNAIYGFLKKPSGRKVTTGCDRCDTDIKIYTRMEGGDQTCRVMTKRYLGLLEKADDPIWLAQCSV